MGLKQKIKSVRYAPKHTKPTDENIMRLLLPSMIGIVICMVCLAGATWAWFSASVTTSPQTITAANYDVTVSLTNGGEEIPTENGTYTLQGGDNEVRLTATGNAATGYCKIVIDDRTYYTPQFPNEENPAEEFTFTIRVSKKTEMVVIPAWGTYTGKNVLSSDTPVDLTAPLSDAQNQSQDSTPPPDNTTPGETDGQTYTIKEGDSLWKIAQNYDGISAEDIAAYNGIENPNALQIGQIIQIPPADYAIPAEPITSVPDTTSSQTAESESSAPTTSGLSASE